MGGPAPYQGLTNSIPSSDVLRIKVLLCGEGTELVRRRYEADYAVGAISEAINNTKRL